MDVIRGKKAGFCMGVILALRKLDALLDDRKAGDTIHTLGPIIHNPQVLDGYARRAVVVAKSPDEIPPGGAVVIRAHGIPKQTEEKLRARGVTIVDATCPKVKKAQLLIQEQTGAGRKLLLYGEERHPEVRGLLSYAAGEAFLFESKKQLDRIHLDRADSYCLAAQTTQDLEIFETIVADLTGRRKLDVVVLRTICEATSERQAEAVRIAREVGFMVVVGGRDSGNTRRLAQVVAAQNTPCLHVETVAELPLEELLRYEKIGLTAGASTPKELIDEVHRILKEHAAASAGLRKGREGEGETGHEYS